MTRREAVNHTAARMLAAWREHHAVARDLPRKRVVSDEVVLELARSMPDSLSALRRIRGIARGLAGRYGDDLLRVLGAARASDSAHDPGGGRPSPDQEAMVTRMLKLLRARGASEEISPPSLASRRDRFWWQQAHHA